MIQAPNWYHNKGITLKMVITFCRNGLGLNPNRWTNLKAAADMIEVNMLKY